MARSVFSSRRSAFAYLCFCIMVSSNVAVSQFVEQDRLVSSLATGSAMQGQSVSLSSDGNTAIVGGSFDNGQTGAAFLFTRSGSTWAEGAKLVPSDAVGNAQAGWSVSLSGDGNTAIVGGAYDSGEAGAAWVFELSGGTWLQQEKLIGSDSVGNALQGFSVALSADGNTAVVGGPYDDGEVGAAWIFTRSGSTWSQQGPKLVGSGTAGKAWQGQSVDISSDGNTVVIGGPYDNSDAGASWVFTRSGNDWNQQGDKLVGSGAMGNAWQGQSVSISDEGTVVIGGPYDFPDGAVWVFKQSGAMWPQQGEKLVGTGGSGGGQGSQGFSVSISADGNTLLEGSPHLNDFPVLGGGWIFERDGSGNWSQSGSPLVGSGATGLAAQGWSVQLSSDGDCAILGGLQDAGGVGASWVFARALPTLQIHHLSPAPYVKGETLGFSATISNPLPGTPQYKWSSSPNASPASPANTSSFKVTTKPQGSGTMAFAGPYIVQLCLEVTFGSRKVSTCTTFPVVAEESLTMVERYLRRLGEIRSIPHKFPHGWPLFGAPSRHISEMDLNEMESLCNKILTELKAIRASNAGSQKEGN